LNGPSRPADAIKEIGIIRPLGVGKLVLA
jgi:hypothetical protein